VETFCALTRLPFRQAPRRCAAKMAARKLPRGTHMAKRLLLLLVLTVPGMTGPARGDDLAPILEAYKRGQYEDVIAATSEAIEAQETAPQIYSYLRGMAAFRIAWFGRAEADLAPLADFSEGGNWPAASEVVERVRRSRELAPAKVHEITFNGAVAFRVYYDVDDKWTQTLIGALTAAHRAVTGFYGVSTVETAVFVFDESERHAAFIETLTGERPTSWEWASGGNGILIFCPIAPGNNYRQSPSQLPETTAHEYSHCLTRRVLGTAAMPLWLNEGLAMTCGALMRPGKTEENDIYLTRMWTAGRILPLRAVTNRDTFYDETIAADAYVQAYAMVRFLVSETGRDGLLALLNSLKQERNIEAAMGQVWNGGLEGFYEDWLAATERRVEKFK
jgi:hypothetical protein